MTRLFFRSSHFISFVFAFYGINDRQLEKVEFLEISVNFTESKPNDDGGCGIKHATWTSSSIPFKVSHSVFVLTM